MEIYNNSVVVGKRLPVEAIYPRESFILMGCKEIKDFVDGAYTDTVIAIAYDVVETYTFNHLNVKIEGQKKPIITNEELIKHKAADEHVMVEFDNLTVLVYVSEKKNSLEDSFKADGIRIVEAE